MTRKVIGFFGVHGPEQDRKAQHDRRCLPKFKEIIGPGHELKGALTESGIEYFSVFATKAKASGLDAAIVTDQKLMTLILESLPDFKPSFNKNGSKKKLSMNDYHGSLIDLPGFKIGREKDLEVLFLNPLEHMRTVPEGEFVFKRFISKITKPEKWFPQTEFTWELAKEDTIDALYESFQSALLVAADIETERDSPLRNIECSGYCALFPDGTTHSVVIPTDSMWGVLWMRKFNELKAPKVYQNGLYDNLYKLRYNSPTFNWLYDTQHLFHSWYSELPKRLDFITAFTVRKVRFWKDDGKSGNKLDRFEYNARDCWATLMSCMSLMLELPDWAVKNYLLEFPLVFPCLHCEADGMRVDKEAFEKSKKQVDDELEPHEKKLQAWVHPNFNPGSSDQCKRLLKVLGCADKQGNVESADEQSLNFAAALHPLNELVISEILEIRGLRKLRDTYLVWEKMWNDRLYCKFNPAGTDTGRLNCAESSFWCGLSLQTIPVRDGPVIRQFIVADEGWLLGENDQPQSEARCIGYMTGCTSMIDLVEGPHDYHSWNASKFFGVPYEKIYNENWVDPKTGERKGKTLDKPLRDLSKRTNHGANYNMGAAVMLATMGPKKATEAKRVLGLPAKMTLLEVCGYLLNQYATTYPEIKVDFQEWIKRTIGITKKLVSPLGWTRVFFNDPSKSKPALNSAVAHPPSNLSVGIVNAAFYKIWRKSVYDELRGLVRIKAQIHDSIFYCYKGEDTPQKVSDLMVMPLEITDIKGVTRTMVIHPDISCGKKVWAELK